MTGLRTLAHVLLYQTVAARRDAAAAHQLATAHERAVAAGVGDEQSATGARTTAESARSQAQLYQDGLLDVLNQTAPIPAAVLEGLLELLVRHSGHLPGNDSGQLERHLELLITDLEALRQWNARLEPGIAPEDLAPPLGQSALGPLVEVCLAHEQAVRSYPDTRYRLVLPLLWAAVRNGRSYRAAHGLADACLTVIARGHSAPTPRAWATTDQLQGQYQRAQEALRPHLPAGPWMQLLPELLELLDTVAGSTPAPDSLPLEEAWRLRLLGLAASRPSPSDSARPPSTPEDLSAWIELCLAYERYTGWNPA